MLEFQASQVPETKKPHVGQNATQEKSVSPEITFRIKCLLDALISL
jgi:hypothetical protein